jgi:hypothetical protein
MRTIQPTAFPQIDLLQHLYNRFNARDIEAVLAALHEDVALLPSLQWAFTVTIFPAGIRLVSLHRRALLRARTCAGRTIPGIPQERDCLIPG